MDIQKLEEDVICSIKACLTSIPGGSISCRRLNGDYRDIVGDDIPFRRLGYRNLETFLRAIPDLIFSTQNGESFIQAKKTEATKHIVDLINNQRPRRLRHRKRQAFSQPRRSFFQQNVSSRTSRPHSNPPPRPLMQLDFSRQANTNMAPSYGANKKSDNHRNYDRANNNTSFNINKKIPSEVDSAPVECWDTAPVPSSSIDSNIPRQVNKNVEKSELCVAPAPNGQEATSYINDANSYYERLNARASIHKWPKPKYSNIQIRRVEYKKSVTVHIVKVSVYYLSETERRMQCLEISSCPKEFISIEEGKEYVAQQAFEQLDKLVSISATQRSEAVVIEKIVKDEIASPCRILQFVLPESSVVDIVITEVISVCHFTFRVLSNYKNYNELMKKMDEYYTTVEQPCPVLKNSYAVHKSPKNGPNRVFISNVFDNNTVEVLYVDNGQLISVPVSELRPIIPDFAALPAQAGRGCLSKLDAFHIPNYDFFTKVTRDALQEREVLGVIIDKQKIEMELYEINNLRINFNDALAKDIITTFTTPTLPKAGNLKEVIIAEVVNDKIILQIPSNTLFYLDKKLKMIEDELVPSREVTLAELSPEHIYYLKKIHVFRARIDELLPSKQIVVEMIDYGYKETVGLEDIRAVDSYEEMMNSIPPQFISVTLNKVPDKVLQQKELVQELLPFDESVLAKVIDDRISVELFMRSKNVIISINETLCLNYYEQENTLSDYVTNLKLADSEQLIKTGEVIFVEESFGLKAPPIPKVDEELFEINVVNTASPSNFFVQPAKYLNKINLMMNEMKKFYDRNQDLTVETKSLTKNNLFAAQLEDGYWYRVFLVNCNHSELESIAVRSCDYGNMHIIPLCSIKPLVTQFRILPFFGINAQLHGVKPKFVDWGYQEILNFREFISSSSFFCCIKGYRVRKEGDITTISVDLIDTKNDNDANLGAILCDNDEALPL